MTTFLAAFLPDLAAGLTVKLLDAAARSLQKRLEIPERRQALERCSGAAVAAILSAAEPETEEEAHLLGDIFRRFFTGEELGSDVAKEVLVLLQGQRLKRESLAEIFEEAGFDAETLPALDLRDALAAFESAFLLAAMQEPALQGEIQLHEQAKQTSIQQGILDRMEVLASAVQATLASPKAEPASGSGKPAVQADLIQAQNVVSGVQILIRVESPEPGAGEKGDARLRQRYLESLRSHCRSLPVAALGGDEQLSDEVTLDQVFIELDSTALVELTEEEIQELEERRGSRPEGRMVRPLSLAEAARDRSQLVILGDPGSGKSSFVKELLARTASARLGDGDGPPGIPKDLLPVFLELRDLAPRLADLKLEGKSSDRRRDLRAAAIADLIAEDCARYECTGFGPILREALVSGECFLVLDGLDEVPPDLRGQVRAAVVAAVSKYKLRHVILTCRKLSYQDDARLPDFSEVTIADLDDEKIRGFVQAWYGAQKALGRIKATEQKAKTKDLLQAALSAELKSLSENPMLLTTMALIHQREVGLPGERVRLYHLAVEILALRWQKHKTGRTAPSEELASLLKDNLRLWEILTRLGYEAHKAQQQAAKRDPKAPGSLLRGEAIELLETPEYLGSPKLATEFLDYVDQRAGLFVGQGSRPDRPPAYRFPHQTLQEYLAGRYMASQDDVLGFFYEHAGQGDFWRVAAQLGAEDIFHVRQLPVLMLRLAYGLCPGGRRRGSKQAFRAELWSGHMAALAGVEAIVSHNAPEGGGPYLKRLRKRLRSTVSGNLPARERIEAGRLLGKLGEPDDAVTSVAKLELCWVPPGRFFFSGAAEGEASEGAFVELAYGYWIGRFPVTQGQFGEFVADGGYDVDRYWPEAIAADYWSEAGFKGRWDDEPRKAPYPWHEPFSFSNHPVVVLTWYEMLAFCRWLTVRAREKKWIPESWSFCLPSEAEWEKAARGGEKLPTATKPAPLASLPEAKDFAEKTNPAAERRYPWAGNETDNRGNFEGFGTTNRPGTFPKGRSLYGCEDLAGNVWEWTRSVGDKGRRGERTTEEQIRGELAQGPDDWRYACGGSYYQGSSSVGCSARLRDYPYNWVHYIGFRVVLLPFPSGL